MASTVRPVRLLLDPDPLLQGEFNDLLTTVNVHVDYCPAEAHWIIGTVERRNAVLRTILERLINDHAAVTVDQLEHLLTPALHAMNTFIATKDGAHTKPSLVMEPALTAERVRSEAVSVMNVDKGFRRGKTQNTKVPSLEPGQRCAFLEVAQKGLTEERSLDRRQVSGMGSKPSTQTDLDPSREHNRSRGHRADSASCPGLKPGVRTKTTSNASRIRLSSSETAFGKIIAALDPPMTNS